MLVHAHAPERDDFDFGVGVDLGQLSDGFRRHAAGASSFFRRVVGQVGAELVEVHLHRLILELEVVFQSVADVFLAAAEDGVGADKVLVDAVAFDDDVSDGVGQGQVALGLHGDELVGPFSGRSAAGADVNDADFGALAARLQDAREQHRVHLRHVVAPQDEHIGGFQVVVVAHGLVQPEAGDEAGDGAGHAKPRVGFDVVRAHPGAEPLAGDVAVGNSPLAGAVHSHGGGAVRCERFLEAGSD